MHLSTEIEEKTDKADRLCEGEQIGTVSEHWLCVPFYHAYCLGTASQDI